MLPYAAYFEAEMPAYVKSALALPFSSNGQHRSSPRARETAIPDIPADGWPTIDAFY